MAISEGAISEAAISESPGSSSGGPIALSANIWAASSLRAPLGVGTLIQNMQARIRAGSAVVGPLNLAVGMHANIRAGSGIRPGLFNVLAGKEQMSKLLGYAVSTPRQTRVSLSKLQGYAVSRPRQTRQSVSKIVGYAAVKPLQAKQSMSKLVAYASVYPIAGPPPLYPTPPITSDVVISATVPPPGFPVTVKPVFANITGGIPSGRDIRSPQQVYPIWEFEIDYQVLLDQTQNIAAYKQAEGYFQQYEALSQQFIAAVGQSGRFLFDAWWDDSRTAQFIATGDGVSGNFTMVRTWGFGALAFTEPVGAVNTGAPVTIYFNGAPVSSADYFFQNNNVLTFVNGAPGAGVSITATYSYYYLCQFTEDNLQFTEMFKNIWSSKVKFRSVLQGLGAGGV